MVSLKSKKKPEALSETIFKMGERASTFQKKQTIILITIS